MRHGGGIPIGPEADSLARAIVGQRLGFNSRVSAALKCFPYIKGGMIQGDITGPIVGGAFWLGMVRGTFKGTIATDTII